MNPRAALVLLGAVALASCVENPEVDPSLDEPYFRCRVEPVLVESCAFFACHGDGARPFRVYGPNRLRLGIDEARRGVSLGATEHEANLRAASAFASATDGYPEPLLVAKPLDPALGGAFHGGVELGSYGDVFVDADDPQLTVLREWIAGATMEESCVP